MISFSILASCRLDMNFIGIVTFITASRNCAGFFIARFLTTIADFGHSSHLLPNLP